MLYRLADVINIQYATFMRLNLHTDYALRILMYLGQSSGLASAETIAAAHGISRNHLVKVAADLADLGYLETRRGRGGGLALARPTGEINVGAVVRAMESLTGFVECFDAASNTCPLASRCGLQGALNLALEDFLRRLDRYTVADLLKGPKVALPGL